MLPLSKKNRESLKEALISEKGFESLMKRDLERQPWYHGVCTLWLALDSESRVGAFWTSIAAGEAPYYMKVLHCGNPGGVNPGHPSLLDHLEFEILCMPEVSKASKARLLHAHTRLDLFNDLARRGFFVYESVSTAYEHYYHPVAVPTNPIDDKALKGNVYTAASSWRLPGLIFRHGAVLRPEDLDLHIAQPSVQARIRSLYPEYGRSF